MTAWSAGFTFAESAGHEFELTFAQFGRALFAAVVSAALYAAAGRLRSVPVGRLQFGSRPELEAVAATIALTTTVFLAGLSLLANRPVPPSVPVIGSSVALLLILAARFGYRLRHEPEWDQPHRPAEAIPVPGRSVGTDATVTSLRRGLAAAPALRSDAEREPLARAEEVLRAHAATASRRFSPTVRPLVAPTSAVARRVRDRDAPSAGLPRRRATPVGEPQPPAPPQPERSARGRTAAASPTASPRRSRTGGSGRKDGTDPRLPGQGRRRDLSVAAWEPATGITPLVPSLSTYRAAVGELLKEVAPHPFPQERQRIESIVSGRIAEPELAPVVTATPAGIAGTTAEIVHELRAQHRGARGSSVDVGALIRIYLLSRIDAMWWGDASAYDTDADVLTSTDLVDLEPLRRRRLLRFRYRRQAQTLLSRVTRAAERRVWTGRTPRTAGLLFTRARRESVALLNRLSRDFARLAPPATPPLWVTSLTRSIEHQHRLRALGYAAMLPSSHCVGYGMDIEMSWFRRFDAHRALELVLLEHQEREAINVIDEGQVWHVCISPTAIGQLRRDFDTELGGDA
ncbi:hypothetical protein [Micromonospora sp. NPDC049679]|uniref:hypothetical protein n=1 Tax=Micromonospora sp. NPDC049679 TaxID=3155920 RepID=UPI003405A43E